MTISGHTVILYQPDYLGSRPAPLLIALHGGGGNAEQFKKRSGFDAEARRRGFRVAYVQGTPIGRRARAFTWNAGQCCGPAARRGVDDAGALARVIETLAPQSRGHPVWIAGHSNGGMMAYRMACEKPQLIDGIVPISGALVLGQCRNAGGIDVLHIHGSDDANVPMQGGRGPNTRSRTVYPSTAASLTQIRRAGAHADLLVLQGAAHSFRDLDRVALRQTGGPVAHLVGQAMMGRP